MQNINIIYLGILAKEQRKETVAIMGKAIIFIGLGCVIAILIVFEYRNADSKRTVRSLGSFLSHHIIAFKNRNDTQESDDNSGSDRTCWILLISSFVVFFLIIVVMLKTGCLKINCDVLRYCSGSLFNRNKYRPPETVVYSRDESTRDPSIRRRNQDSEVDESNPPFGFIPLSWLNISKRI